MSWSSRLMRTLFGILLLAAMFRPHLSQGQDANAVFASLVERYAQGVEAAFVYSMSSDLWDQELFYSGQILLAGDRYRIDNGEELIIGHGLETRIYRPADNQIVISRVQPEEISFAPLNLFANYDLHYEAGALWLDAIDGADYYVLDLIPLLKDPYVREVSLWVRQSDGIVARIEALDNTDTRMSISLADVVLGPHIASNSFVMPAPEGVEIIDLR